MKTALSTKLAEAKRHEAGQVEKHRVASIQELCAPVEAQAKWWEANKNRVVHTVGETRFTLDDLHAIMFETIRDLGDDSLFGDGPPTPVRCFSVDTDCISERVPDDDEGISAGISYSCAMTELEALTVTMASYADISIAVAPPEVIRGIWAKLDTYDEWLRDLFREALTIVMRVRKISAE